VPVLWIFREKDTIRRNRLTRLCHAGKAGINRRINKEKENDAEKTRTYKTNKLMSNNN
jgi:hypothetical protein